LQAWDQSVEDGTTTGKAYCSLHAARQNETMGAGDVWYYRGGQVEYLHTSAYTLVETAGTATGYSSLICDTDGAIFGDSSPGRTVIRWQRARTTAYTPSSFTLTKGFDFGCYGNGDARHIRVSIQATHVLFENCRWLYSLGGWTGDSHCMELFEAGDRWAEFVDCEFEQSGQTYLQLGSTGRGVDGGAVFTRCRFFKDNTTAGGAVMAPSGGSAGIIYFEDCDFGYDGSGNSRPLSSIFGSSGVCVYLRGGRFNATTVGPTLGGDGNMGRYFCEDWNDTPGDNRHITNAGVVQSETSTVRSGGGDKSLKMVPNSFIGINHQLVAGMFPFEIPVKCTAASTTITVYLNTYGYTTMPTAAELYIEVSYLNHATRATRARVVSTDVVSSNGSWTAFDVTFTPAQAGLAYVDVHLTKYEASSGVYVDPVPVKS
jgi:hypothetical protein